MKKYDVKEIKENFEKWETFLIDTYPDCVESEILVLVKTKEKWSVNYGIKNGNNVNHIRSFHFNTFDEMITFIKAFEVIE